MERRMREAIRYLGYGKCAVDDRTLALIEDSFRELEQVAGAKDIYRIFELQHPEEDRIQIEKMNIESRNLAKNLRGCREVIVYGATLGCGVDMLMKKYSLTDMPRAVVMQACAAAMLEEFCDGRQREIEAQLSGDGKHLRPRFSPGYGDFSITHQGELLRMLDAAKKIGLTMTDSMMLTPIKSITAVMGISTTEESCSIEGCEACDKKDCLYRRS